MNKWVYQRKRLITIIVSVLFVFLIFIRVTLVYEVDASGNPDYTAFLRSFFDSLMATILVTISVAVTLKYISPPIDEELSEKTIQPFQIDEVLRKGALQTKEWYYLGHTAKYIRSQILHESLRRNENKLIKVVILDPSDTELCRQYAQYRNHSRSNHALKIKWTTDSVRNDLIATILCMIELKQLNSMLTVDTGLIRYISLFRVDISSSMALVTQEDKQEPAIYYSSKSHFYRCYRRELELSWSQSNQLKISNAQTNLDLSDIIATRSCLEEVGFNTSEISDADLKQASELASKKVSPYVGQ
ncbi:MAG: hypothetical protein Roseis2KO_47820 [Roseivirga sp.]